MKIVVCKGCGGEGHYRYQCFATPRKPLTVRKRIRPVGKRGLAYREWRDTVAIPYLDSKGHACAKCGVGGRLDVDHIKNRGSHPELVMELSNVQYLCRPHHQEKTDG